MAFVKEHIKNYLLFNLQAMRYQHDMENLDSDVKPVGAMPAPRAMAAEFADQRASYLKGLNPRQLEAVETLDGPLLVLAGAGTGKTKTLTTRIAHILCTGKAWPSQILGVTFTNKAAAEMRQRVEQIATLSGDTLPWLGTFHSISARLLRRHAELVGRNQRFTILNENDQQRAMKQLIEASNIDEKKWPARQLATIVDKWKNNCWIPSEVPQRYAGAFDGKGIDLYREYQDWLERLNAVDFGDLLMLVVQIFLEHEDVLVNYQRHFKYILVDEYQDINNAQYQWLRLLAQDSKNICCVGDEDQSIYGWRGADVGHILEFESSFEGTKVVRLEQNYRSTRHILACANGVISHNRNRLGKSLRTDLPVGEKVRLIGHWDGAAEATWIGGEIEALNSGIGKRRRFGLNEIAILVRASFLMRELEERFISIGLPYRVIGGPRFYERQEVRDALAYLRLAVSNSDDLAFLRVVNLPKRGIGEKSQLAIRKLARQERVTMFEAAEELIRNNALRGPAAVGLQKFLSSVVQWSSELNSRQFGPVEMAERIIDEAGLPQMWLNTGTPDAEGRVENLKELVRSIGDFDNMEGFLEHVSLVVENLSDVDGEKVSIMTLHAAKGLEFPVVFLPGWEEGIFPSIRAQQEINGLEEERRLAYVGITRAMELCTVSCASSRSYHGSWNSQITSRFIDELPPSEVETMAAPGLMGNLSGLGGGIHEPATRPDYSGEFGSSGGYGSPGYARLARRSAERDHSKRTYLPTSSASQTEGPQFAIEDRVFHQKFGYGSIRSQDDERVVVDFDCSGEKHIIARFLSPARKTGT